MYEVFRANGPPFNRERLAYKTVQIVDMRSSQCQRGPSDYEASDNYQVTQSTPNISLQSLVASVKAAVNGSSRLRTYTLNIAIQTISTMSTLFRVILGAIVYDNRRKHHINGHYVSCSFLFKRPTEN